MHYHRAWIVPPLLLSLAFAGCKRRADLSLTQPALSEPAASSPAHSNDAVELPSLEGHAGDVSALVERVKPVVVNITTKQEVDTDSLDGLDFFFGPRGRQRLERIGIGSGFITDPGGHVITNEHVVHGADEVRIRLSDEREFDAKVVGRDPQLDLALLKVSGASGLPAAKLGSSDKLKVGEPVIAVGNPFGLGHTVTKGIVSAKERAIGLGPYDDFIQTDASINPGNSGGPLFNLAGEVVGINTAIRAGATGIGFAIPVDTLKEILPALSEKGHVDRGKLGVTIQRVSPDLARALGADSARGALVTTVEPGGPADHASLRPKDVIIALDSTPLRHAEDLPQQIARHPPGTKINITILRDGKRSELTATLAALKPDETSNEQDGQDSEHEKSSPTGKLGLSVQNLPGGQGVRVVRVAPGSPVSDIGEGDVIIELSGTPIHNVNDLHAVIERTSPGSTLLARIRRGDATRFAAVPIPGK